MKFLSHSRSEWLDLAVIALYNGSRNSGFLRLPPSVFNSQQPREHDMLVKRISVKILPRVRWGVP